MKKYWSLLKNVYKKENEVWFVLFMYVCNVFSILFFVWNKLNRSFGRGYLIWNVFFSGTLKWLFFDISCSFLKRIKKNYQQW